MRIEELMTKNVRVCRPEDSMKAAAQLMWDGDCGDLPVVDGAGKLVGIITDRDICMGALMKDQRLAEVPVSSAMQREVEVCRPEDPISVAEKIMTTRQVRRVPVVDAERRVLGVLSINDLALQAAQPRPASSELTPEAVIRTLAAVCAHRPTQRPAA